MFAMCTATLASLLVTGPMLANTTVGVDHVLGTMNVVYCKFYIVCVMYRYTYAVMYRYTYAVMYVYTYAIMHITACAVSNKQLHYMCMY